MAHLGRKPFEERARPTKGFVMIEGGTLGAERETREKCQFREIGGAFEPSPELLIRRSLGLVRSGATARSIVGLPGPMPVLFRR